MISLARAERGRLCDSAVAYGADAPTLCGDWTVRDLLVHLVVREGDLLGAPGIVLKPLAGFTERATRRLDQAGLESLVRRVRRPPAWSPYRFAPVDRALNTLEYFVHHEDIRRARPHWEQRRLAEPEQREIWKAIGFLGRGLVRPSGVPVQIAWTGTAETHTLASGQDPVVVGGLPAEVTLFLFGRAETTGLTFTGPPESVAALRKANLGL